MAETHQQARQTVLTSDIALSREWFTKHDMQKEGDFSLDFVTVLLNLMAQDGQLQRTVVDRVAHFKVATISRKKVLTMPWRQHTNTELRVTAFYPWAVL